MPRTLHANAIITTTLVASVVVASLFGSSYELTSSTAIVYEPNVPALDGQLDGQDFFGSSIAAIGDLDGNGITELAVGAPGDDDSRPFGAVWILFLGTTGNLESAIELDSTNGNIPSSAFLLYSRFGSSLTALGDIDGDGLPDLAVGDGSAPGVVYDQGAMWVLHERADGSVEQVSRVLGGAPPAPSEGCDIVTTTTTNTSTTTSTTSSTTVPDIYDLALPLYFSDQFATALSATNAFDGVNARIAAGAPYSDADQCESGALWLVDLDEEGRPSEATRIAPDDLAEGATLGRALTWLGDLDADGTIELAVTAPMASGSHCSPIASGELRILSINAAGTIVRSSTIDRSDVGWASDVGFGEMLANLGDLDGDDVPELVVGVSNDRSPAIPGWPCEDSVWILFLASDGSVKSAKEITLDDPALAGLEGEDRFADSSFGRSAAGLGDVDGDGVVDLAIGTLSYRAGPGESRGAVFIVYLNTDGSVKHARRITDETSNGTTTSTYCPFGCHGLTSTTFDNDVCGDVDGGGTVESTDALAALHAAIGLRTCSFFNPCDVNCSGDVTAIDALMILRTAINLDAVPLDCEC